jgi:hypothetical protein
MMIVSSGDKTVDLEKLEELAKSATKCPTEARYCKDLPTSCDDSVHVLIERIKDLQYALKALEVAASEYLDADSAWNVDEIDDESLNRALRTFKSALYESRKKL